MRRREFLRAAAGTAGLAGLSASALPAAAHGFDRPRPATDGHSTDDRSAAGSVATDHGDFGPLGRVAVTNDSGGFQATEAATTPDGRYAFVSKLDGFHTVDLADPADPVIVATREGILGDSGPALGQLKDLKYDRERLLVVSDGGSRTGLAVFDVSDPTDPRLARSYETGYPIHNADLYRDHAYLTTGLGLDVVDVATDPPSRVAAWSIIDYDDTYEEVPSPSYLLNLHDVTVQNGRAYLAHWDAGAWILDVSDPTEPTHIGHAADYTAEELAAISDDDIGEYFYEPPGNAHYAQPNDDGTLLAVGVESWDIEGPSVETDEPESEDTGGPGGITLHDIADPTEPRELATIDPPLPPEGETARRSGGYFTTAHNFDIVGDVLYSSWYRAGVKVHDISDPADPVEVAHWADGSETSFWTARCAVPGEYFVGVSHGNFDGEPRPGGLYVFPDPAESEATITPNVTPTPTASPTATPTATEGPTERPTGSPIGGRAGGDDGDGGADAGATAMPTDTPAVGDGTTTGPATPATDPTTSAGGPGLGVLAGLASVGIGAWRFARRADDGDGDGS
jgi:hypothetical protein